MHHHHHHHRYNNNNSFKNKNADLLNDFLNRLLSSFYIGNYDGSRKGGIGRDYAINNMWNEERGFQLAGIYQVELTGSGY